MKIIHVDGGRGSGKSTTVARLATEEYPNAVVLEEHRFGTLQSDAAIGRRRFVQFPNASGAWLRERLRGVSTVILAGGNLALLLQEIQVPAEVIFVPVRL